MPGVLQILLTCAIPLVVTGGMERVTSSSNAIERMAGPPGEVGQLSVPQGASHRSQAAPIRYDIRIEPAVDRADLVVTARLTPAGAGGIPIGLPDDREFGTPNLSRFLSTFDGLSGTTVEPGERESERVVRPGPEGEIVVSYRLSFDPDAFGDATYAPNVGPRHVYVAGSQWMLRIGDLGVPMSHEIHLRDLPDGWHAFSSLGPDPSDLRIVASYEELEREGLGAVAEGSRRFLVRGNPIDVHIARGFQISRDEVFGAIERIVTHQRELFEDFSAPFFNIVILPRPGNVAGIALPNLFVTFLKQDVTMLQLSVLVSHEMLHTWMGPGIRIGPEDQPAETFVRNQWLIEGVTDYLARRILYDTGVLTLDEFAGLLNRDILNLADNPHRGETFAEVMEAANAGRFGNAYMKLSYYRGALIALGWETRLRKTSAGVTVGDVVRDLYWAFDGREEPMRYDEFHEFIAQYGLDVAQDVEAHIMQGRPITLDPDAFGETFELREVSVPSFSPGFSVRSGVVTNVDLAGPAFRAGLREGMEVVGQRNASRFSNAWDPDQPLVVTVREGPGERDIAFFPHGPSKKVTLYFRR